MKRIPTLAWLLFIVATIAYSFTAAPSIYGIHTDTLEFQVIGPTLGIAHPTGYPLYLLLSGLWSRVLFPIGAWAWRMNLFSAVTGGLTISMLYMVSHSLFRQPASGQPVSSTQRRKYHGGYCLSFSRKIASKTIGLFAPGFTSSQPLVRDGSESEGASTTVSTLAALAAAGTFALGAIWWSQTTVAEVYTLHALLIVIILYSAIRVGEGRSPIWLFFWIGLGLAHHRTTLLMLPAIAVYLLLIDPKIWRPTILVQKSSVPSRLFGMWYGTFLASYKQWVVWASALLLPLLLYAYSPIRAAMGAADLSGIYTNTWSGFLDHVLARQFGAFFAENDLAVERSLADWLALFQGELGIGGLLFALIGLGQLFGRWRAQWLLIVLTLIANLIFVYFYRVGDIEVFLLPIMLCAAIFAGGGLTLIARAGARLDQRASRWIARAGVILLLLPKILGLVEGWANIDRSDAWYEHNRAVEIAKVDFPRDSYLIGLEGEISALTYMQRAEKIGQNVTGVIARSGDETERIERISSLVAAGKPTYLTREVSGMEGMFSFSSAGPLIRVWPRAEAAVSIPASAQKPVQSSFVDGKLNLDAVEVTRLIQPGNDTLRATFYWRPSAPIAERLKLSLRLQQADGKPVQWPNGDRVIEDRFPLGQATYTEYWHVGELIRDTYYIELPSMSDPSEIKTLLIILYNAQSANEVGRVVIPL